MRDYRFEDSNGVEMSVSEMPTSEIKECLADGIIERDDVPAKDILERLRIELLIRELGL